MTKKLNQVLAAVLTIAALMTGQSAWATEKTVTYTFTAEKVDGQPEAMKLTFTPSGNQFGTTPGAKTVTIPSTSNTSGFTVELDDGVILTFSRNPGYMTFSSSGGIILTIQATTTHASLSPAPTTTSVTSSLPTRTATPFMVSARRRPPATPCSTLT